jgi:hypothetical protein
LRSDDRPSRIRNYPQYMLGGWRSRLLILGSQVTLGLVLAGIVFWPALGALALPFGTLVLLIYFWPRRRGKQLR